MDRLSHLNFVHSVARNELGPEGAKILAEMLSVSSSMTFADLSGNVLEAKGAEALSPALRSTSLTSLNLADTKLGVRSRDNDGQSPWINDPSGIQALAKELSVSTSMTSLK